MSQVAIRPEVLAASLASRLIHDAMGPASGVVSGLDLFNQSEGEDMRGEALALAASSGRQLVDRLTFFRVAWGGGPEAMDTGELERLAQNLFVGLRPRLEWFATVATLPAVGARTLLGLVHIAADAVAAGGTAVVTVNRAGEWAVIRVEARGPRLRIPPETLGGLAGEALAEGVPGRWAPAFFLHACLAAAGGSLNTEVDELRIQFEARLP
jgi:histidine phosphotransferase ChpT